MALVPLGEHPAITAVLAAASGFELGQISEEEMHEAVRQNHLIVMRAMGEAIDERIIHRGFQVLEIALCSSHVAIQEAALAAITYAQNVNEQKISDCVEYLHAIMTEEQYRLCQNQGEIVRRWMEEGEEVVRRNFEEFSEQIRQQCDLSFGTFFQKIDGKMACQAQRLTLQARAFAQEAADEAERQANSQLRATTAMLSTGQEKRITALQTVMREINAAVSQGKVATEERFALGEDQVRDIAAALGSMKEMVANMARRPVYPTTTGALSRLQKEVETMQFELQDVPEVKAKCAEFVDSIARMADEIRKNRLHSDRVQKATNDEMKTLFG